VAPGAEAQIDFGTGAWIVDGQGRRRRSHVLRVILSYSRKGYSEALPDQKSEGLLRALENAFRHFGGVPATLVPDNLKAAAIRADWWDPELNPRMEAFARHYGAALVPTRPRTPWHKGKIERGIGYVKGNALHGRRFASLAEENRFLTHWEEQVEEWGKLVGDVPAATAILDRFLHHADIVQIRGRSFRLKDRAAPAGKDPDSEAPELPTASPPSPTSRGVAHSRRRGDCG
jgi:hypothetical protein